MTNEIKVVKGPTLKRAGDIPTYLGAMSARTLIEHQNVPHWNATRRTGYQRNPSPARVGELARRIRDGIVDLPTAVLLNLREPVTEENVIEKVATDRYKLNLDSHKSKDEHRLFIVDGQHRICALEKAVNDYEANVDKMKIPFVLMIGATEQQEMEHFYVVNKHAKPVPTDLAYTILANLRDSPIAREHIRKRGAWEMEAQDLVDRLYQSSIHWKGRIKLANLPSREHLVPATTFIKSLKDFLGMALLSEQSAEQKEQILDAYWSAIGQIYPNAKDRPREYTLQKGVGVFVFHRIYPVVADQVRNAYQESLFKPDGYVTVMREALGKIEGINGSGESIMGEKFWLQGDAGAAGPFSSAAGRDRLIKYLLALLPSPDIY